MQAYAAAWRRFRENRAAVVAAFIVAALVLLALVGPLLSPNRADALDWQAIAVPPTAAHAHWLGTDRLGRDLFVRTLEGTQLSLLVGLIATLTSLALGISYGAVAGFAGGRTDELMMRFVEIVSGLPLVFFVIVVGVLFGRGLVLLFVSIGAVSWLTTARIVRGQTLSIVRQPYIEAAVAGGVPPGRIIRRHVIPNLLGPVVVYATLSIPQIMLFESFLSFLGLGVQEPRASLGALVSQGVGDMETAAWILLVPGGLLALLLVALNICGDGLRDALDVKET